VSAEQELADAARDYADNQDTPTPTPVREETE